MQKLRIPREIMLVVHAQNTKDHAQALQYTRDMTQNMRTFFPAQAHAAGSAVCTCARASVTCCDHMPHTSASAPLSRHQMRPGPWSGSHLAARAVRRCGHLTVGPSAPQSALVSPWTGPAHASHAAARPIDGGSGISEQQRSRAPDLIRHSAMGIRRNLHEQNLCDRTSRRKTQVSDCGATRRAGRQSSSASRT